jgi:tetratricopeptide (TPR) repeat protein
MRDTLPFAPVALRELAAHWQKQLAELDPASDAGDLRSRLAQVCLQIFNTDPDAAVQRDAVERILALHDARPIDTTILEKVAEIAKDQDDIALLRRVLERLVVCEDPAARKTARERLGEIFEREGNRRAAVESWRVAAQLWEKGQGEQEHARSLYERVLETAPDDGEAAQRLLLLYAECEHWNKVPELMGVVLRTDCDRGSELLLKLAPRAVAAGARDVLVSMIDEAVAWLRPSSMSVPDLQRAKARALAAHPPRYSDACEAFRALIDAAGAGDDLVAYESLISSIPDDHQRRGERRWLHQWRAAREAQPAAVLLAWAQEEEGQGDHEAALAVYRRLAPTVSTDDGAPVGMRVALLHDRRGRPGEAMAALGPLFALTPPCEASYDMARRLLVHPGAVEQLERIAGESNDVVADRLFGLLVEARTETASMPAARRRWLRRMVELPTRATTGRLAAIALGAIEFPDDIVLWQEAERQARELGYLDVVVRAYGAVIAAGEVDAALADALGRRVVELEGDCNVEPSFFVELLRRVLDLAPSARWSLDRVKLALGSQARWDDLFRLYDRAIDATPSADERADLLDEAAFAARDLAGDSERAIGYFASLHALRPDDAAVSTALERLYELRGRQADLVELLAERAERSHGATRQQVWHRIAALRLDLGQAVEASAVVDAMIDAGAAVADVAALLERLVVHPGQSRATDRLREHYESIGRLDEAAGLARTALERADNVDDRARCVRDLVRLRVSAARGAPGMFVRVLTTFEPEVAGKPALAQHVYREVLLAAISAWKQGPADADSRDAADGAWRAVDALKVALLNAGQPSRARRLLERSARLPFEPGRRRELLEQAVTLCTDSPGDRRQAIRLYGEIFDDHGGHAHSVASLGRFASLLGAAGENGRLAQLWEEHARHRAEAGDDADLATVWRHAAAAWERHGSEDRAVAAHERAATLGCEDSFESLARIYQSRSQWPDAVRVLEWLHAHVAEPARERYALPLAGAYLGLGRRELSRSCLERALRAAPTRAEVDEIGARLAALYRVDSDWEPLAKMLSDAGRNSDSSQKKVSLFREAAAVLADELHQPAEAAAALELAVAADPRDSALRLELAGLLEGLGQFSKAAEVLKECIAMCGDTSPKERALLHRRMALALRGSADLDGALAQLRAAVALQPVHPLVLDDLGRVALEAGCLDVAASAYRTLLLALRHPIEKGDSVPRSRAVLGLARVALLQGDQLHAASLLETALDEALDEGEDPRAFEGALHDMGRDDLLAQALERRIERTLTLTARVIALRSLVDLWIERLGRDGALGRRIGHYAETLLRELAEEQSASGQAWSGLWSILVRLEEAAGHGNPETLLARLRREERLESLLQTAITAMPPGPDRARLRVLLARTQSGSADSGDEAIALLSSALDEDPDQIEAVELLAGILERERRLDALATLLERRLARIDRDAPAFGEAALALGRALELAARREDAVRLYESILDSPSPRVETIRALTDRLEALESTRLADGWELRISLDPDAARGLAQRLIDLREAERDDAGLVRALELGIAADPTNRDLVLRAVDAHRRTGGTAEALRLLDGAIATRDRDPELLGLRAAVREATGDEEGAVSDLLRIGTPEARSRAQRALDRLLERDPHHAGALERVAALAAAEKEWGRAADAYGRLLPIVQRRNPPEPDRLSEVAVALADACERGGRASDAREPLESVVRALPGSAPLAQRLEGICEAAGDHERLVRLLEGRAERTTGGAEKAALLLRVARLFAERVGAPERALPFIERARSAHPESVDAALAWSRAKADLGQASEALPVLLDVVARNRGKRLPALGRVYLEIGKAYLASDDLEEAFDALKAGFAVDPRCSEIAVLLGLLAVDLDDDKTAERALVAVAMATSGKVASNDKSASAHRVVAMVQLAAMAEAKGEATKAHRWATAAAREDPGHAGARALLERLGTRAQTPRAQIR